MYGAEQSLALLALHIDKTRFTPVVVIPESRNDGLFEVLQSAGIKVYTKNIKVWPKYSFFDLMRYVVSLPKTLSFVKQILVQEKPDCIYTNGLGNSLGLLAHIICRKPHIWHVRDISHRKIIKLMVRKLSSRIITVSKYVADVMGLSDAAVIYNAVSQGLCKIAQKPVDLTEPKVALIGRIVKEKGHETAIRAISSVKETFPNVKLVIVGNGDSQYVNYLKNLVINLQVDKNVKFLGFQKQISKILENCDVCLVPSKAEPFGRVVIEAMALGVPVIAANSGGIPEIIDDGIDGILVPPNDIGKWAMAIKSILTNQELREIIIANGLKKIQEEFSITKYVQNIEKVISDVINNA